MATKNNKKIINASDDGSVTSKPGRKAGRSAAEQTTTDKRKRGRPKGTTNKRPDSTVQAEPGDNTKFILHDMKLYRLPKIDINNLSQVKERVETYFDICAIDDVKPSVASFALSLGISRITLFTWITGKYETVKNKECLNTLKTAYDFINSYYEHMMNNGKINPVAGIFLMKNNMGYKDTTDYVLTANQDNALSLSDIAGRANLLSE